VRKIFLSNLTCFISVLFFINLTACDSDKKQNEVSKLEVLPPSANIRNSILLVADTGSTGMKNLVKEIKRIYNQEVFGLYEREAIFDVQVVNPLKMNDLLRRYSNIIYVSVTDPAEGKGNRKVLDLFSPEMQKRIAEGKMDQFYQAQTNVYARDQTILFLFGDSANNLLNKIRENPERFYYLFEKAETERDQNFFKRQLNKGLVRKLKVAHKFSLLIPNGYQPVIDSSQFVWFRDPNADYDYNIVATYKPYVNEDQFDSANVIEWINTIHSKYVTDPDDSRNYLIFQDAAPVRISSVNFNGLYAKKVEGLWRMKNRYFGGPMVGYIVAVPEQGRIYYLEGFLMAPGQDKANAMRTLASLLKTFEPTLQ
jgi:hypothetical protein